MSRLADLGDVLHSPPRAPQQPRSRKRWAVVACIAALWAFLVHSAGSAVAGTVLLVLLAAAGILLVAAVRCLGVDRNHSWKPQVAWPWSDVREVTDEFASCRAGAHLDSAAARTVSSEFVTVTALASVPMLRLVTGGRVSETRVSGARAGRAREAELRLPEEPTVSRVHAEFTFRDGRWHVTNLGLNGVTLNGTPLTGEHMIRDGDSIGWGTQPGALASRVEIGWNRARQANGPR